MKKLKYFSTLLIAAIAILAVWFVWNDYMQSPWTRDGKIRAEQVDVTPQVSGSILSLNVKDNQFVKAGETLFTIDPTPWKIALMNADAKLAKAQSELSRASNEAARRRGLSTNAISAEDREASSMALKVALANADAAKAERAHAHWQLSQTDVKAPVDGWVTNLTTRVGNYAAMGHPVFALIDSHSFYVVGYFEETKLRHIREGDRADIVLYSDNKKLQGHVSSVGRAIHDQSLTADGSLVADIKPTIPWVRLAQRVPVRIQFESVPADTLLVAGTTCTVSIVGKTQ
ncbi:HlyD family secretion protein [Kluyvera intermedia]|uniref:HlyD family secretion protein n=1 Tax=Kluyvera intermedia TaxID=61648 RepID=A0AA95FZ01_KLUIN|nr:HlyD family secretion protein [Kluyvera intermedia]WGL54358.1 HlyD family secretion protein [Kluyvera intermedia]